MNFDKLLEKIDIFMQNLSYYIIFFSLFLVLIGHISLFFASGAPFGFYLWLSITTFIIIYGLVAFARSKKAIINWFSGFTIQPNKFN